MADTEPQKLRVLLSAYACQPNAGTEPGNGWNWATHLAARGMEIHVLTRQQNRERIEEYLREHPKPGIEFHYPDSYPGFVKPTSGVHYSLWQISALKTAKRLTERLRFDVAHHVTYGSVRMPSQLWRLAVPFISGPLGGGQKAPASLLPYFGRSQMKERIRTLATRSLRYSPLHRLWCRRASMLLAANSETMRLLENLGCKQVQLYFDVGLPESFYAEGPRRFDSVEGPLRLLWVGRMLPLKGLPLTLDALAQARTKAHLTIIGGGMSRESVEKMIAERGLEGRVDWRGRQEWLKVRQAYMEHDALVFTSLRDACGAQLLESMAMGLPVIALDLHGGHDLIPEEAGIKVKVTTQRETVRAVADAIDSYAALPTFARNRMSEVGWNLAKTQSWTKRAAFAESLYRKLIQEREEVEEIREKSRLLAPQASETRNLAS
jgi:glycosyltransferase involved in cell wall biosynthesis